MMPSFLIPVLTEVASAFMLESKKGRVKYNGRVKALSVTTVTLTEVKIMCVQCGEIHLATNQTPGMSHVVSRDWSCDR